MKKLNSRIWIGGTTLTLGLALVTMLAVGGPKSPGNAPRIAPAGSMAFGKSLTQWCSIHWRWFYSGADMAQSKVDGVQLMPLPAGQLISGSGTPADPALYRGSLEITVPDGAPFVLPAYAWLGERYQGYPGVADDLPVPNDVILAGVHPVLTIDGRTVLSDANKAAYYIPPTTFDPIIIYPEPSSYGSIGAVFFQGGGIVSMPLSVGVHTIHLYEPFVIPAGTYPNWPGFGVIYDNTWTVTVVPTD